MTLRPFWNYYGSKWRIALRYPAPKYDTIIEPFAGSAGYSLRYPHLRVILVDCYPVVAGIWRYLISAKRDEILAIPTVEHVEDLPSWVPQEARWLVGFCLNSATTAPCARLSSGLKRLREHGQMSHGWFNERRARVASQVDSIRHWKILEHSYRDIPNASATWFIDPPYNNRAGSYYVHNKIDHAHLGAWCRERTGQTIVCENEGASWLPFRPFIAAKAFGKRTSHEMIWTNDTEAT